MDIMQLQRTKTNQSAKRERQNQIRESVVWRRISGGTEGPKMVSCGRWNASWMNMIG
jgi:hypothetical protein